MAGNKNKTAWNSRLSLLSLSLSLGCFLFGPFCFVLYLLPYLPLTLFIYIIYSPLVYPNIQRYHHLFLIV
jgi:hypothetical protein